MQPIHRTGEYNFFFFWLSKRTYSKIASSLNCRKKKVKKLFVRINKWDLQRACSANERYFIWLLCQEGKSPWSHLPADFCLGYEKSAQKQTVRHWLVTLEGWKAFLCFTFLLRFIHRVPLSQKLNEMLILGSVNILDWGMNPTYLTLSVL